MSAVTNHTNIILLSEGRETLPGMLFESRGLQVLNLGENKIRELTREFCSLTSLVELHLGNNRIGKLPEEFSKLKNIRKLHLGENELVSVDAVAGLDGLEELWLGSNRIVELPEGIGSLPKLRVIHLGKNPIEKIPESIVQLADLKIFLHDSPKSVIPEGFQGSIYERMNLKQSIVDQSEK